MSEQNVGIIVDGIFEIRLDFHAAFIEVVGPHLLETRARAVGCIYYAVAKDVLEAHVLHFMEGWTDRQALDAHLASESVQAIRAQFVRFPIHNYRCTIYSVCDQVAYVP